MQNYEKTYVINVTGDKKQYWQLTTRKVIASYIVERFHDVMEATFIFQNNGRAAMVFQTHPVGVFSVFTHVTKVLTTVAIRHLGVQTNTVKLMLRSKS